MKTLIKKQATTDAIAAASPVRTTEGLRPHEVASLAFVLVNSEVGGSGASGYSIKSDMEKAGFTPAAAQLGLIRLNRLGFVESFEDTDYNGNQFTWFRLTTTGQDWFLDNQEKLEIKLSQEPPRQQRMTFENDKVSDGDVPF